MGIIRQLERYVATSTKNLPMKNFRHRENQLIRYICFEN